jgi:predicted anti-sigma-YlaC factor YlaD
MNDNTSTENNFPTTISHAAVRNQMQDSPPNQEPWQACPPGEISNMVTGIRREQRRKALRTMALASSTVVLGGLGVYALTRPDQQNENPAGLACAEVKPLLPKYVSGDLPLKLRRQITQHLEKCHHCREVRERII